MNLPKRKSPRLKDYDYSTPGYYFVTMCTHNKQNILCDIVDGGIVGEGFHALPKIQLSDIGKQVESSIEWINLNYTLISVDKYVIMPNHIHLIVIKHSERSGNENLKTGWHGDPITGGRGDPITGGRGDPITGGRGDPITGGRGDPITGGRGDPPLLRQSEIKIGVDDVMGRFKSYTTKKYGKTLWQRSFHDHIIRGEKDYRKIWQYINTNPLRWKDDCFYLEY